MRSYFTHCLFLPSSAWTELGDLEIVPVILDILDPAVNFVQTRLNTDLPAITVSTNIIVYFFSAADPFFAATDESGPKKY